MHPDYDSLKTNLSAIGISFEQISKNIKKLNPLISMKQIGILTKLWIQVESDQLKYYITKTDSDRILSGKRQVDNYNITYFKAPLNWELL